MVANSSLMFSKIRVLGLFLIILAICGPRISCAKQSEDEKIISNTVSIRAKSLNQLTEEPRLRMMTDKNEAWTTGTLPCGTGVLCATQLLFGSSHSCCGTHICVGAGLLGVCIPKSGLTLKPRLMKTTDTSSKNECAGAGDSCSNLPVPGTTCCDNSYCDYYNPFYGKCIRKEE